MKTNIVPVKNLVLKEYIQYFIFFNHDAATDFTYSTFPNTNLCLTVYRQNNVVYTNNQHENKCLIYPGKTTFSSRLLGFHNQLFNVEVKSQLDQFCILFHPGGLKAFTRVPYKVLAEENDVFGIVFKDKYILEHVYDTVDPATKALLLETFLLKQLISPDVDSRVGMAMRNIYTKKGNITINELSDTLMVNASTLYRRFTADIGQSPKDFIQTVRFRYVLSNMLTGQYRNLSELTYLSNFYDQSHFIKDFKKRSGNIPQAIHKCIRIEQNELAWIIDAN